MTKPFSKKAVEVLRKYRAELRERENGASNSGSANAPSAASRSSMPNEVVDTRSSEELM